MKRIITLILIVVSNFTYALISSDNDFTDPVVIEITDTSLNSVYYHQNSFTEPTKLVFTNLTSVSGSIYFHQNVNLVEVEFPLLQNVESSIYFHQNNDLVKVEFPLLESIGSYFYFNGNLNLEIINAPSLTSVTRYLSISGNVSLTELNICSLTEILPEEFSSSLPYYNISNNNSVIDAVPQCFSIGAPNNLVISNVIISENEDVNSLVGTLSADSNGPNEDLIYYLTEYEFDNEDFSIDGNQLITNSSFDYETKNEYVVEVGVRNLLGEKLEIQFTINVEDVINENVTTIEITDTTLDNVYYHQNSFTEPTKLVFTNLTSVSGSIYFHQNVNLVEVDFPLLQNAGSSIYFHQNLSLVEVDFPLLESTGSYFYFNGNLSLEIINAPNLTSVTRYLSVSGNESLLELNICNLTEIVQDDSSLPYYNVSNNNSIIDAEPQCFSIGAPNNLIISNSIISENQDLNTIIGTLSADSNGSNEDLIYYLTEYEFDDNENFLIIGNELVTNTPLDFEGRNEYVIEIGVRNHLGEKLESEFTINVEDIINETITTIEITDTTLDNIYYHKDNSFITPTKLVFTNLTSVNGSIYFYQNVNLVEVDFPMLENTGSHIYFDRNLSLEVVNAPALTTIANYLYVSGNESLTAFNVCNLIQIQQVDDNESYYYIRNNSNLDISTTCLTITDVIFSPVDTIVILPAPNTLIGTFISDSDDLNIQYYFVDDDGNQVVNEDFVIVNNELYLAREYEDYIETDFNDLIINAIRTVSTTTGDSVDTQNRNSTLNERIELVFSFSIDNAVLGVNDFNSDLNEISINPNPAKQYFRVYSKMPLESITIYGIAGNRLRTYDENEQQLYVGDLPSGIYLVNIKQKNNSINVIKRLIVD
ncbi:T9SS type A sorting domain-containing protein [uncultured Winogradskyella sp.]|uniref:T9SS type A sorting domain-containing protein n=1 Tax=uncultured Winogradskyella sp. TaxID=395353 RepID=UPI0026176EBA|nr:T9SS type A sorting domain-containing protein [uncultured Winogradskyella sp.]